MLQSTKEGAGSGREVVVLVAVMCAQYAPRRSPEHGHYNDIWQTHTTIRTSVTFASTVAVHTDHVTALLVIAASTIQNQKLKCDILSGFYCDCDYLSHKMCIVIYENSFL